AHPLPIGPQHLRLLRSRIPFFWSKHAVRPAIAAMVLGIATFIRPCAYNIGAAASSTRVPAYLFDHVADYFSSPLTLQPPPDFPIIPDRFRKLPVQNLFKTYPKPVESCSKHYPNLCISLVCAKLENGCCA